MTENLSEISLIENRLKDLENKNFNVKEQMKQSFHINLFNLQKEKGIDIITRIVDILLLTGEINEFLEKILAENGCQFLASDDEYLDVLKRTIYTHSGVEISGANIEDSPNGLHILTLLYNKIRFQVTSSFKNHRMVPRLIDMTKLILKSKQQQVVINETFSNNLLKHLTQLWIIIDQYERTANALRMRKDLIDEYRGSNTWFWIDDRHGIWHPISAQHNVTVNKCYRNGLLKAYSKHNSNNDYIFNFVSLTQKNEESQMERPIMLLPPKRGQKGTTDMDSEYESKIISCVPECLVDTEVSDIAEGVLQFLVNIKIVDSVNKWDCVQAACYLLVRLCDGYPVANNWMDYSKLAIPNLCTVPHLKQYTQQLITFVMILLRQQFETTSLLQTTLSNILLKNAPKGATILHKPTTFNDKLTKDVFYFVWDNIPLLCRNFNLATSLIADRIDLSVQHEASVPVLKSYPIIPAESSKLAHAPFEIGNQQIAVVRFLVESALTYYIEKNDVWHEMFKKQKFNNELDLKNLIVSPNSLLDTQTVVTSNIENNFSSNQQSVFLYKFTGKDFLVYLMELLLSYEFVGTFTINLRLFNRPMSFYLINIYLQESCKLLDSIRSKDPSSLTPPSINREQIQFQQLVSLQLIEGFLLTIKESYEPIILEIVRTLKIRSHHKDGDTRNTYIVVIMKLLNDFITRLPVAVSKKLVILMYKYRLPNDLCRLLSVVDCTVVQHKAVLVDILTVVESLCRPDRQMYITKRQRTSKTNIDKRTRRQNANAVAAVSEAPATLANTSGSQEMEGDDVFYVDINAWSRNSRTENADVAILDNIDSQPVDVEEDEEMDEFDDVEGVLMSDFRDIDPEYDFDDPQMYDDDNNTESETDYEEIEEDEGSAGSQDGDSQGDRFDEDMRETETTTTAVHSTGRQQDQSRRIFQILNHNYYNINHDTDNPERPDNEPLRDRLSNVLMTTTYRSELDPGYLLNDSFTIDEPASRDDSNTFRLGDNLYFVTNSRGFDVASEPANFFPNDLAGSVNSFSNSISRTSSLESGAAAPVNAQEENAAAAASRGWRGPRYMRVETRTWRPNNIRNLLSLNRGSFVDRTTNNRSPSNRLVADSELSLDSVEGDLDIHDILTRGIANIQSAWSFLNNQSATATATSNNNNFMFADIFQTTILRRWLVQARMLYGREISDMVMLARAHIYQELLERLQRRMELKKAAVEDAMDTMEHIEEHITTPEVIIDTTLDINEEMLTPTPSELMDTREETIIESLNNAMSSVERERRQQQQPPSAILEEDIENLSVDQLIAEGIDPSFLEALPSSMRREVIMEHRRANRVRQELNVTQLPDNVDASIMAELPPNIQEEILSHYRRGATSADPLAAINDQEGASGGASRASGIVDSSFLLSLAPSLRREILADMDQSQVASLSSELADEARQLRQESDESQLRALQANILSVASRRRTRQLTSGLTDLLSQMNRGRWDQRNIRYVVFSERGQTASRHNNAVALEQPLDTSELPNLSAYKPLVSTDGLTNLIALLITSSTSPSVMKVISTLTNKILQSLTCHPQIRAWISCTIINILLKISLPKDCPEPKQKLFSSPTNSESSILCTPMGSGSFTDLSRSSSIHDDSFRQLPNNKSLFFHSFERGFALTDQVFVPSISKIYKHKNKSGIQSMELPEVTIHDSVTGSVAKSLIDTLATISNMHAKEFYPTTLSSKIPTNFWFTLAWYMSLKGITLEDQCPETHLPPKEDYDYFTHLLCLIRLPLMQTNNIMLEKLLSTIFSILKAYYKSFPTPKVATNEYQSITAANTIESEQPEQPGPSTEETTPTTKEKLDVKPAVMEPHLGRVNIKTIAHLLQIICAKENSAQASLPTDKCRALSERLLIELSKGNVNTKTDIIKLLTSNIETILESLTDVLHNVMNEAVDILEREVSDDDMLKEGTSSPMKKSNTAAVFMEPALDMLSSTSPGYDTAFTSASSTHRSSQTHISNTYSRNNSLPHIAFNQLKMESIKPFTANTGDHLNLLDLLNLVRKIDNSVLTQFQSPKPIWTLLSQVLEIIQKSKEPDAVIVFQSVVESFLLCHSDPSDITEDSTKPNISYNSDLLSHLNTQLVVDSLNSPSLSELGSSNPFLEFVDKHRKVCNHILRRRTVATLDQSNFSALLKYPKLLDFDIKRRYFQAKITQLRNEVDSRYEEELVQVSRARLFEDSYGRLHRKTPEEWKQRFCIKFINEEGQDGGGLLREWYLKMSHEIFNPNYVLFKVSPDGVTYTINPASYVNSNHLSYFKFVGRFIAKAIFDNKLLTCYFTRAFYKHILGIPIRYTDLEKEDYQFFRGLEFLLKNHVSTMFLEQTFTIQINEFGKNETRELISNGAHIFVTEDNKQEYVRLVCQEKMKGAIRQQLNSFLEGFYEIIPKSLISIFNEKELELLICGLPDIDLNDLKANTLLNKYTPASQQIQWFWQALESFEQEDLARFIQFVTGTSKVPLGGFSKLEGMNGPTKFQISLASMSTNHLPAAHTCFNSIDLPPYESYDKLRKCLLMAVRECSEGYGMI